MKLPKGMTATVSTSTGVNLVALLAGAGAAVKLPGAGPDPDTMTEKAFQAEVMRLAHANGFKAYHTHDSRRSPSGFPDVVLAKPGRAVIYAELKTETGATSAAQDGWLAALRGALGTRVFVWRPRDLPMIERILRGEDREADRH